MTRIGLFFFALTVLSIGFFSVWSYQAKQFMDHYFALLLTLAVTVLMSTTDDINRFLEGIMVLAVITALYIVLRMQRSRSDL